MDTLIDQRLSAVLWQAQQLCPAKFARLLREKCYYKVTVTVRLPYYRYQTPHFTFTRTINDQQGQANTMKFYSCMEMTYTINTIPIITEPRHRNFKQLCNRMWYQWIQRFAIAQPYPRYDSWYGDESFLLKIPWLTMKEYAIVNTYIDTYLELKRQDIIRTYYARYGTFLDRCMTMMEDTSVIHILEYDPTHDLNTYVVPIKTYWKIKPTYCLIPTTTHPLNNKINTYTVKGKVASVPLIVLMLCGYGRVKEQVVSPYNQFPLLVSSEIFETQRDAIQYLQQQINRYYQPSIVSLNLPQAVEEFKLRPGSNLLELSDVTKKTFKIEQFNYQ
jgi:hypothetical protein